MNENERWFSWRAPRGIWWLSLETAFILIILICAFSAEYLRSKASNNPAFPALGSSILQCIDSPSTQWLWVTTLALACLPAFIMRRESIRQAEMVALVFFAVASYIANYQASSEETSLVVFLAGLWGGLVVRVINTIGKKEELPIRLKSILFIVVLLLAFCGEWSPSNPSVVKYHEIVRLSGPFSSPDTFGLLMGVGVVMSAGLTIGSTASLLSCEKASLALRIQTVVSLTIFVATSIRLIESFTRGAWIATFAGFTWLGLSLFNFTAPAARGTVLKFNRFIEGSRWLFASRERILLLVVTGISFLSLLLANHRYLRNPIFHRLSSITDLNDFSWRNRAVAYKVGLQMMAEKPWFGYNWNSSEKVYAQFYRSTQFNDGTTLHLNDYLKLGVILGIPAFFIIIHYIWSLVHGQAYGECRKTGIGNTEYLKSVCRASAMVIVCGICFEGGLFRWAIAAPLWILLELGVTAPNSNKPRRQV